MSEYSNFIILYNAREGSSAIVSMLSAQKSVHVPLFEDLDRREFKTNEGDWNLPSLITKVFQTGDLQGVTRHFTLFPKKRQEGDAIGFKLRLQKGYVDLPPVLKAFNVKVFVLSRRNFMELLSSHYVNAKRVVTLGDTQPAYPQFAIAKMSEQERKKALDEIDLLRMKVDCSELKLIAENLSRTRKRLVDFATGLARRGIEIVPIFYEDFVDDRVEFISNMLTSLGFPPDWPIVDQTKLTKVMQSPAKDKLHGWVWQWARARVQTDRIRYWRQLRRLEKLRTPN